VYHRPGGQTGAPKPEACVVSVFKPIGVAVICLDQCIELTEVFNILGHQLIISQLDNLNKSFLNDGYFNWGRRARPLALCQDINLKNPKFLRSKFLPDKP
jgi:hypothetical protein